MKSVIPAPRAKSARVLPATLSDSASVPPAKKNGSTGTIGPVGPTTSGRPDVATRLTLADAVRELPPQQRAVVVLRYFHDLTEADTARILGLTVGTVKSHHSRALAALRINEHLADDEVPATEGRGR